jgi:hypothetical protein
MIWSVSGRTSVRSEALRGKAWPYRKNIKKQITDRDLILISGNF